MNNETNLQKIQALISGLSLEDLRTVNRQVYDMITVEKQRQGAIKRHQFKVGDSVKFQSKYGTETGTITKMKRTKAFVRCASGPNWDVPFALLTKVET